jgi:mRNA interferase MazF
LIARGDIRWFRFSAPDKRMPVLVLGRGELLDTWSQIPVIPLSTQARDLSWEVRLTETDGLPSVSVLKPEWIRSVERADLGPLIAQLPTHRWEAVREAVLEVLGFEPTER